MSRESAYTNPYFPDGSLYVEGRQPSNLRRLISSRNRRGHDSLDFVQLRSAYILDQLVNNRLQILAKGQEKDINKSLDTCQLGLGPQAQAKDYDEQGYMRKNEIAAERLVIIHNILPVLNAVASNPESSGQQLDRTMQLLGRVVDEVLPGVQHTSGLDPAQIEDRFSLAEFMTLPYRKIVAHKNVLNENKRNAVSAVFTRIVNWSGLNADQRLLLAKLGVTVWQEARVHAEPGEMTAEKLFQVLYSEGKFAGPIDGLLNDKQKLALASNVMYAALHVAQNGSPANINLELLDSMLAPIRYEKFSDTEKRMLLESALPCVWSLIRVMKDKKISGENAELLINNILKEFLFTPGEEGPIWEITMDFEPSRPYATGVFPGLILSGESTREGYKGNISNVLSAMSELRGLAESQGLYLLSDYVIRIFMERWMQYYRQGLTIIKKQAPK